MIMQSWDKHRDLGILLLRLGIGAMIAYHGTPKILGGMETWVKLGSAMKFVGIDFAPALWGFLAAIAEFGGGILLVIGLFIRPVSLILTLNMIVAIAFLFGTGAGLPKATEGIEIGIVFLSLILIGPDKYSLDAKLQKD